MKKLFCLVLPLVLFLSIGAAFAEDLGVQVIGGDENSSVPVSLDDLMLEKMAEIPGWCEITPTFFDYTRQFVVRNAGVTEYIERNKYSGNDRFTYGNADETYPYSYTKWEQLNDSGSQAQFVRLGIDILNTTSGAVNFIEDVTVKVIFKDEIEYAGWVRQRNFDLNWSTWLNPADNFRIDPYYVGHYVFGCTLPNSVVDSKEPLRIEITLGKNELTYHIRK